MKTRTASEIAALCGADLEGDGSLVLVGPASLREARRDQVSFLGNPRYAAELRTTSAGAIVVGRDVEVPRRDLALLRVEEPNRAFSRVVEAFRDPSERQAPGVDPTAAVHPLAEVERGASVGALSSVGARARIGRGSVLHPGVVVGPGAEVGEESELHPGVVLYPGVRVGSRCTVHAGAVLGADGFGFDPVDGGWEKIPHCGTVVVEDDVEIGACCTIDRARFGVTRIGRGAKLDNLVHVGHNVEVGEGALLIAQVGISGSSSVGRGAVVAGQTGVSGHVAIGDGARIGAGSGVSKSLPGGIEYWGVPARPRREAWRLEALKGRLPELFQRLRDLERRVAELEGGER